MISTSLDLALEITLSGIPNKVAALKTVSQFPASESGPLGNYS